MKSTDRIKFPGRTYVTRPVKAKAVRFTGENWIEADAFLGEHPHRRLENSNVLLVGPTGVSLPCRPGDWLLCDESGEVSVMTDDRFNQTYTPYNLEPE